MIKEELYKYVVKEKGYLILVIFLILKIMYSGFIESNSYFTDNEVEKNKAKYLNVIQSDKDLSVYIEEYDNAEEEVKNAFEQNAANKISYEQLNKIIVEFSEILNDRNIVSYVKSQRDYVNKHHGTTIVYQNGWNTFFTGFKLDLMLFVLLFLITGTLFTKEYEQRMHSICNICTKGGSVLFRTKVMTGLIINEIVVFIWWMTSLLIALIRYGFTGYDASIQSLYLFEDCPWNISIKQMAIYTLVLLLIYGFLFTMTLCFISVLVKNTIILSGALAGIVIIPCTLFSQKFMMKYPFLSSYVYFEELIWGVIDDESNTRIYMSHKDILIYLSISVIICIILFCLSWCVYNGRQIKFRWNKCICLTLICSLLAGCKNADENSLDIFSNIGWNTLIAEENKTIYSIDTIHELLYKNGFDEEQISTIIPCEVSDGELLFIEKIESGRFSICGLNIDNNKKRLYYSNSITEDEGINYLQLRDKLTETVSTKDKSMIGECCWRQRGKIYYLSGGSVFLVKSKHKSVEIINDVDDSDIAVFENNIYYVNRRMQLAQYDIENNSNKIIVQDLVKSVVSTESALIYSKIDGAVCSYSYETAKEKEICKSQDLFMNADNNYIYFSTDTGNWYRINIKSGKRFDGPISENLLVEIKSTSCGEKIYVSEIDSDGNNILTEY